MTISVTSNGGDLLAGKDFQLTNKPTSLASAAFIAVTGNGVQVERRVSLLFSLPDDTPVIANWHGQFRTDAFLTSVGELKALAADWKK